MRKQLPLYLLLSLPAEKKMFFSENVFLAAPIFSLPPPALSVKAKPLQNNRF